MSKGFGLQEYKRVTMTQPQDASREVAIKDSVEGNQAEEKLLAEMTRQKLEINDSTPSQSHVVLDDSRLEQMIQGAITVAVETVSKQKDVEIEAAKKQLETQFQAKETEMTANAQKTSEALIKTEKSLEQANATLAKFEDLFKLTGAAQPNKSALIMPNVNLHIASNHDKIDGILNDVFSHIDQQPKVRKITRQGAIVLDYDKSSLDRLVKKHYREILEGLGDYGKRRGWFAGSQSIIVPSSEAATTVTDLPGGFLDVLSALIRMTHRPGFIFHQFPLMAFDFAAKMGTTIQVGRFNYLVSSNTLSDYNLSGGGTFASIRSDSDPLQSSVVSISVEEWGRGKTGAVTDIRPISIPSFVEFYSAYDLVAQLNMKLGFDYARFEDRKIRSYWDGTSVVVYNKSDGLATLPASLNAAGQGGTFTRKFMIALYSYAHANLFEPLEDGCYILALNPTAVRQFKIDLDSNWEAPTEKDLMALANILNPSYISPEDTGRVSGYLGKWEGFHVFESNAFGVGVAGSDGVQNETLGGALGAKLTRTSYLAGAGTVGRGVSMPMEIRQDSVTNFDRESRMTWISWEGFAALDVDPVGYANTSQQLRVMEIHTLDDAI